MQDPIPIYILGGRNNPGPGTYTVDKPLGSESPTIHMHVKHKPLKEDETGEPGKYDQPTEFDTNKMKPISMHGPSERTPYDINDAPGPGTYKTETSTLQKGGTIGQPYSPIKQDETGDPGKYDQKSAFDPENMNKISLHGEKNRSPYDIKDTPGPGTYKTDSSTFQKGGTIGQPYSPIKQDETGEPGKYDQKSSFDPSNLNQISMHGPSNRSPYDINKTPGPGTYKTENSTLTKGGTIGTPYSPIKQDETGDPGKYDQKSAFDPNNMNRISMHGPSDRSPYDINDVPGPATYKTETSTLQKGGTIGQPYSPIKQDETGEPGKYEVNSDFDPSRMKQKSLHGPSNRSPYDINDAPGPATYRTETSTLEKGGTIGQPYSPIKQDETGDPGKYDQRSAFDPNNMNKISMHGPSNRSPYDINDTPGPSTYRTEDSTLTRGGTIGQPYSPIKQDETGDPGKYDQRSAFDPNNMNKISMHGPSNRSPYDINDVPGPSTYRTENSTLTRGGTIGQPYSPIKQDETGDPGKYDQGSAFDPNNMNRVSMHGPSNRSPYDINKTPGPGTYVTENSTLTRGGTIGQPYSPIKQDETGEPGKYDQKSAFDPSNMNQISMHGPSNRSPYDINDHPGPATYKTENSTLTKGGTIGQPYSPIKQDETGEPGKYDQKSAFDPSNIPPISMHGISNRSPYDINNVPGPAFIPSPPPVKGGTIGQPYSPIKQDPTGEPGKYDPKELKTPNSATNKIHERPTPRYSQDDRPSPADYSHHKSLIDGKAKIHMHTKPKEKKPDPVPGPGTYYSYNPYIKGMDSPRRSSGRASSGSLSRSQNSRMQKRSAERTYAVPKYTIGSSLSGPRYSIRSRSSLEIVYS